MPTPRPTTAAQAAAQQPSLLLVDDDPLIVDVLAFSLRQHFAVSAANSRPQALQMLEANGTPALALIDLGLPPSPHRPDEGFALIKELMARTPRTRILVLTGQSDDANGRRARALGAIEFIAKPCDPGTLLRQLNSALALDAAAAPARGLIGDSPPVQKLRAQLAQFADSPFPVLIEGESGSGKEIVAREHLHANTRRAAKPFLALNCAAISPSLVEPTLFGHAKGAFTGATGTRPGYFEDVEDGTLFLDEIGELPLDLQAKLLRVLENGEFQRVGETQTRRSRARIVAATNRDLREEMRGGRFRVDLYHRLSVFTLNVPPLRDMGDDRNLLLEHFRAQYADSANSDGRLVFCLDEPAQRLWNRYHFPGNVRELRNIVIRLTAKYAGQTVDAAQLENELDLAPGPPDNAPPADLLAQARQTMATVSANGQSFDLDALLNSIERSLIEAALEISQGNVSQAAKLLGVGRTTLYSRMDKPDA
jgi:DNA-binding NtrC family response regulator